jgi:DNA-binding response OmpR family regulator
MFGPNRDAMEPAKATKSVLFIDDHDDTREMIAVLLSHEGFQVTSVQTSAQGLALAKKGGFDLILMDLYLPDLSGINICEEIRGVDTHTPIIFYTAEARESERKRAMDAGCQAYLLKPIDLDEFLSTVRYYTEGESLSSF